MNYTVTLKEKSNMNTTLQHPCELEVSFFDRQLRVYYVIGMNEQAKVAVIHPMHVVLQKPLYGIIIAEATIIYKQWLTDNGKEEN